MKNTALGIDYQKGIKQDFTLSCSGLKGLFVSKSLQELSLHIKATFLEHGHKTDYAKICYCMHIIYNLESLWNHRLEKYITCMQNEVKKAKCKIM